MILAFLIALSACVKTDSIKQSSIASDLKISAKYEVYVRKPKRCKSEGFVLILGCTYIEGDRYIVEINPFNSPNGINHIKAHELAHVKQFESGFCTWMSGPHHSRPHEIIAENYANCVEDKGTDSNCGEIHRKEMQPYLGC